MGNDVAIIGGIALFFIVLGIVLPLVRHDLDLQDTSSVDSAGLDNSLRETGSGTSLTIWSVIKSCFSMFLWTFGVLPVWIDALLLVPRLMLVFIVARNIWIGGGA